MAHFLLVTAVLAFRHAGAQPGLGQLRGTVVDSANKPVTGARITLVRQSRFAKGRDGKMRAAPPALSGRATTDAAGTYHVPSLAAGRYDICVEAPGHLTTCEWEQWGRANVAAGAAAEHRKLVLTKGAVVSVRINDPKRLVRSSDALPLVGVRDQWRRMHAARRGGNQGDTYLFEMEAPYSVPLTLVLHSARFTMADSQGVAVSPAGADVIFQVPAGAVAPTFTFTITGEMKP